jgi:hypothetical protein
LSPTHRLLHQEWVASTTTGAEVAMIGRLRMSDTSVL